MTEKNRKERRQAMNSFAFIFGFTMLLFVLFAVCTLKTAERGISLLDEKKARLIEMTVDGKIDDKEIRDFKLIQDQLKQMEETIHSLQLWIEHYIDKN